MNKEFIPYELALKIKHLGFNEPCFRAYDKSGNLVRATWQEVECSTPTFSQAFRWFREKYGDLLKYDWGEVPHFLMIQIEMTKGKTYEEAELACLTKLIEIVEQQKEK